MATHDSEKAREVAKEMRRVAGKLRGGRQEYRFAADRTQALAGATAVAMDEYLHWLITDIGSIESEISAMSKVMTRYADTLEQLDKQLAGKL